MIQNIKPRKYQEEIFETCKNKNCLVVLPTGIGKTLIALMLSVYKLKENPYGKILFLAPTRPLAEQHLNYYKTHLPELFGTLELFTGKVKAEKRKQIWQTADIIFSTPQCISNDIKNNLYNLEEVSLLIEDECHRCIKNYAYTYVAREYKEQAKNPHVLGLTASPGHEKAKIKKICKNLGIEDVEIRTRESEDVKEYLQDLEFEIIKLDFPGEFNKIKQLLKLIFDKKIDELKNRKLLFGPVTKVTLLELQKKIMRSIFTGNRNFNTLAGASAIATVIKLQHALELLETQTLASFQKYLLNLFEQANQKKSKAVQQLVKQKQFNQAYTLLTELIAKKIEHPKLIKLKEIVEKELEQEKQGKVSQDFKNQKIFDSARKSKDFRQNRRLSGKKTTGKKIIVFAQYRDTVTKICKTLNELPQVQAKVFVGQAKKAETGLSQEEQKQMIKDFSFGKINVLCSTSIGEEGLDIPEVNAVIFYEPIPSEIRKIQRAGRTARLIPGKLIILITKATRDEGYYWSAFHKEKRMHKAIDKIKQDFKNGKINTEIKGKQKTLT